jgi:hypothetical protein
MSGAGWRRFHAWATVAWFLMAVPIVLLWSDSVLVVGLMSAYANAVGHFSAWQATRAETESEQ